MNNTISRLLGNKELDSIGKKFFSIDNKNIIYMKIQNRVFNKTGFRIDYTKYTKMELFMTNCYIEIFCEKCKPYTLDELNTHCINKSVNIIIDNLKFQKFYLNDISIKNRFMVYPKHLAKNKELGDTTSKIIL